MKSLTQHINENNKSVNENFEGNGVYLISDDHGITAYGSNYNFSQLQKLTKDDDEFQTDVYFPEGSEVKVTEIKGKKLYNERIFFVELVKLGKGSIPPDMDKPKTGTKYISTDYSVFSNTEMLLVENHSINEAVKKGQAFNLEAGENGITTSVEITSNDGFSLKQKQGNSTEHVFITWEQHKALDKRLN